MASICCLPPPSGFQNSQIFYSSLEQLTLILMPFYVSLEPALRNSQSNGSVRKSHQWMPKLLGKNIVENRIFNAEVSPHKPLIRE